MFGHFKNMLYLCGGVKNGIQLLCYYGNNDYY